MSTPTAFAPSAPAMRAPDLSAPSMPAAPSVPDGHRPSVRAAWYWENRKAPNRWYWVAVSVLCSLASLGGYLQYRDYQDDLQARGISWDLLWPQSTLMLSMLFLPLALGAFEAQVAAGEHRGRNWQRMRANRLEGAMVAGKLLHGLQVAATTTAILVVTTAVAGLVAGFDLTGLAAFLPRFGVVALGMWVILTFVTWLGVVTRSFATTMTAVLLSSIAGMAMLLVVRPLGVLNPMAVLTRATAALTPETMTSPGAVVADGVICLVWVAVLARVLRRAVRRHS
mgnify:FL=1